uniref:Uncharacterized protein n=1 Tax=viral metagenome TaxID=1070528 RepID=A0A6C0DCG4_9ZZZZ
MDFNDEVFKLKYLKYKNKYLELKEQQGGLKRDYAHYLIFITDVGYDIVSKRYNYNDETPNATRLKFTSPGMGLVLDTFSKFTDDLTGQAYMLKLDGKSNKLELILTTSSAAGSALCNACDKCTSFYRKINPVSQIDVDPLNKDKDTVAGAVQKIFEALDVKIKAKNDGTLPIAINRAIHLDLGAYGTDFVGNYKKK